MMAKKKPFLDIADVSDGLDPKKFFIKKTAKDRIFEILQKYPTISNEALYFQFPGIPKNTIRTHKREWNLLNSLGDFNVKLLRQSIDSTLNFIKYKTKYSVGKVSQAEKEALDTLERFVRGEKV